MNSDENELYFSMKFTQDIVDLFINCKEIIQKYNIQSSLSNSTADDLEEFLYSQLIIEDPYIDNDEIYSDEENYLNNHIYE